MVHLTEALTRQRELHFAAADLPALLDARWATAQRAPRLGPPQEQGHHGREWRRRPQPHARCFSHAYARAAFICGVNGSPAADAAAAAGLTDAWAGPSSAELACHRNGPIHAGPSCFELRRDGCTGHPARHGPAPAATARPDKSFAGEVARGTPACVQQR